MQIHNIMLYYMKRKMKLAKKGKIRHQPPRRTIFLISSFTESGEYMNKFAPLGG